MPAEDGIPLFRGFCGLLDQLRDDARLRYIDGVAALHLDRGAARAFGHKALKIGIDHAVLRCHGVPAWLAVPRCVGDRGAERACADRNLGDGQKVGVRRRKVGCEVRVKGGRVDDQEAFAGGNHAVCGRRLLLLQPERPPQRLIIRCSCAG